MSKSILRRLSHQKKLKSACCNAELTPGQDGECYICSKCNKECTTISLSKEKTTIIVDKLCKGQHHFNKMTMKCDNCDVTDMMVMTGNKIVQKEDPFKLAKELNISKKEYERMIED